MIRKYFSVILMVSVITLTLCGLCFAPPPAAADSATVTGSVTASASVSTTATLTVSSGTIAFAVGSAYPDTTPSIIGNPESINITAKAKTAKDNHVTLTVLAGTDLSATGGATIAISKVTWTATDDLTAGTLSKTTAVTIGDWANSGNRSGTLRFALANDWGYAAGAYTAALTFTLLAP